MESSGFPKLWLVITLVATVSFLGYGFSGAYGFALIGCLWLFIGGFLGVCGFAVAFDDRSWRHVVLYLALLPLAFIYSAIGAIEGNLTVESRYVFSPSKWWITLVRERPYEWHYEAPHRSEILIKPTILPFFSLFGRTIFVGQCPDTFGVTWQSDDTVKIGCSSTANTITKADALSDIHIEYTDDEVREKSSSASAVISSPNVPS